MKTKFILLAALAMALPATAEAKIREGTTSSNPWCYVKVGKMVLYMPCPN